MIIDNFLPENIFQPIEAMVNHLEFPWFFIPAVANKYDNKDSYFIHTFYHFNAPNSAFYERLTDLIKKLEIKALIRVRAIRYVGKEKFIEHEKHVDFDFPHKSMVLYLNTNNGFTRMENGKTVNSIRNRALFLDGCVLHNSTNCTNEDYRLVLTVNYF